MAKTISEGNLQAPIRHPIDWKNPDFFNEDMLYAELARVFDHCHGCRRCVSLCNAFPTLFDLVDESDTFEVDGVDTKDYVKVVDHCYLCDLCYQTKCPYTPPHEWNIDFPHLMLRAKAVNHKKGKVSTRDKILSSTDAIGKIAGIPIVANAVNGINKTKLARQLLDKTLGVHPEARIPEYSSKSLRRTAQTSAVKPKGKQAIPAGKTSGKVVLFTTCYANYNEPQIGHDLIAVFQHNDIHIELVGKEKCCGMPKLELGDLDAVEKAMQSNIPNLLEWVEEGFDIIAPVPSCVLMFKQELPLMFPDNPDVSAVSQAIYDPFEYLMVRHKADALNIEFAVPLGKVAYHVACHQRVQLMGLKTKQVLELIPDTTVDSIERCSGHDGTYGVKSRFYPSAKKIARPVVNRVKQSEADYHGSDCPMAGRFIEHELNDGSLTGHPISLLRKAYAI